MTEHKVQPLEGESVSPVFPYGVGVDCHSKFIAVCVLMGKTETRRFEEQFTTDWPSLQVARKWVMDRLGDLAAEGNTFRYTLESTGCYHNPVRLAWEGFPSVVNPLLAGSTKRKTDRLDARLLAYHSLTGLWPQSFVCPVDFQPLRLLMLRRRQIMKDRGRALRFFNNCVLRYGNTIGSTGSLANAIVRSTVCDWAVGLEGTKHLNLSPLKV